MFANGRFHPMTYADPRMPGRITGIVETGTGELWMNGASGIHRAAADALTKCLRHPSGRCAPSASTRRMASRLVGGTVPVRSMVQTADGRLWFATTKGIAWLDAGAVDQHRNLVPPPVHIKSIAANGASYAAESGLTLPTRTESIQIDYDGGESDDTEAGALPIQARWRRQRLAGARFAPSGVLYEPETRPSRFQVVACNSDGVWNDAGATVEFTIPPTFTQSSWFKGLCVIGLASVLLLAYRLRMAHVTGQLRARIHERAAERERIARDLHDTFFQSIQGLLLRFHTATSRLQPDDPARPVFEQALEQSDDVMAEGRELLVHLHGATPNATDLPGTRGCRGADAGGTVRWIQRRGQRLRSPSASDCVRGTLPHRERGPGQRLPAPSARAVEAELDYGPHELRMRIRDDGRGIESSVLKKGRRDGHLGLASMRERSRNIGAQLGSGAALEGEPIEGALASGSGLFRSTRQASEILAAQWVNRRCWRATSNATRDEEASRASRQSSRHASGRWLRVWQECS